MFWNRKTYNDEQFGELVYQSGYWLPTIYRNGDKFYVHIEGPEKCPSIESLEQAKLVMSDIEKYEAVAFVYITSRNIQNEIGTSSPLILESIFSMPINGTFDLCFGVEDDDWAVTVHFENFEPFEVSLVH